MTPAGLRQVPGHRTGSGSMMSATELSCCLKKVTLWLLTPLRSASYSNTLSPPVSSPSLEPEVSKLLPSLSDTCGGLRWARPTQEVQGTAHSLGGASRVEIPSVASLPWKPPASARTPLVTGRAHWLCRWPGRATVGQLCLVDVLPQAR